MSRSDSPWFMLVSIIEQIRLLGSGLRHKKMIQFGECRKCFLLQLFFGIFKFLTTVIMRQGIPNVKTINKSLSIIYKPGFLCLPKGVFWRWFKYKTLLFQKVFHHLPR